MEKYYNVKYYEGKQLYNSVLTLSEVKNLIASGAVIAAFIPVY